MPNLTNPYYPWFNGTTMVDLVKYSNTVTGDLFGILSLFTLYLIIFAFFKSKNFHTLDSFAATSFICAIVAVLLATMEIIAVYIALAVIILVPISIFLLGRKSKN